MATNFNDNEVAVLTGYLADKSYERGKADGIAEERANRPICRTCQHFRRAETRNIDVRPWKETVDLCCHPSEAHPLHWQEVPETFGCTLHTAKAAYALPGGQE